MRPIILALIGLALMATTFIGAPSDDKPALDRSPLLRGKRTVDKDVERRLAIKLADENEAEYQKAIEANKQRPGAVAESEVARLHRLYSDSIIVVLRDEVKSLHAEIEQLREQIAKPKVEIRPANQSGVE